MLELYTNLILPNITSLERSIKMNAKLCYSLPSLTINSNGETCLPADWQYLPLLTVFHRFLTISSNNVFTRGAAGASFTMLTEGNS